MSTSPSRSAIGTRTTAASSGSPATSSSIASPAAFWRATPRRVVEAGLIVASVAGAARHHAQALADEHAVALGRPLTLRRDPDNEHDPNAIAVHAEGGVAQLGWVPREVAVDLAPALDAGRPWAAVALRERRASPRDPRTGLTMLLAPAPAIELRVR